MCVIRILDTAPRKYVPGLFSGRFGGVVSHAGTLLYRNTVGVPDPIKILRCVLGDNETYKVNDKVYSCRNNPAYELKKSTFNGLCGALICLKQGENGVTIGGIHTAGNGVNGRGIIIEREFLEKAHAYFSDLLPVAAHGTMTPGNGTVEVKVRSKVHNKSPLTYQPHGSASVYGSIDVGRNNNSSNVKTTLIANAVGNHMKLYSDHVEPDLKSPRPKALALADLLNTISIDSRVLHSCYRGLLADIKKKLTPEHYLSLHPYNMETVVNGAAGIAYVDAMNFNTSMGHPYRTSKKKFLHTIDPTLLAPDGKMFSEEVLAEVEIARDVYRSGRTNYSIFSAHLKDEAVSESKRLIGKTRIFTGAPIVLSILMRQYFLCFVRLIQNNKFIFECAVGTNAMSSEWRDIYRYLTVFGTDRMVAGDFKAFDKKMSAKMILTCFNVLISLAREHVTETGIDDLGRATFTEEDITVMIGIATDTAYPVVEFFGDLVQFYGSNPSGHPLTVIINCLANSLYMRYAFHGAMSDHGCNMSDFQKYVKLITYGDDNTMNVSPDIDWFNHTVIQQQLKLVGVEYTMPDKTSESVPFMDMKDVDFLKRKFVMCEKDGFCYAPLDIKSIAKMLNITVLSKNVSEEDQNSDIIRSANREFWFYGQAIFEERHKQLLQVIDACQLTPFFRDQPLLTFVNIKESIDHFKPRR